MLNCSLTVAADSPHSHNQVWKKFTDFVVERISTQCEGVVFMLWGSAAHKKAERINKNK